MSTDTRPASDDERVVMTRRNNANNNPFMEIVYTHATTVNYMQIMNYYTLSFPFLSLHLSQRGGTLNSKYCHCCDHDDLAVVVSSLKLKDTSPSSSVSSSSLSP